MRLNDVRKLLDENGIEYRLTVEPNRREYYEKKGFRTTGDAGAFYLLTIPNPNHSKNLELNFEDASENPKFCDLDFGGFWYELFDCPDDLLREMLLEEISKVLAGKVWVVFATNAKNGAWFFDGVYYNEADTDRNDMDELRATIEKIKRPKSLWRKLTGRRDCYEIFNWTDYEKIIK
jgi:hypothetical protein